MFTISLLGQNGGTGKTTIALGLAVAAARAGHAAAILDIDPQASAARWKDRRAADNPVVVSAQASRLKSAIEAAAAAGVAFAIIDTAGRKDDGALAAARFSDLVLIPTRPSVIEVETLGDAGNIVRLAGSPAAYVLLNGVHPSTGMRGVIDAQRSIEALFKMPVCPAHLCHRSAYAEAPTSGHTPQELDAEGKAAAELAQLFKFTCEIVNKRRIEHVEDGGYSATA